MNDKFPKLEEAKKILKRSFHIWSALPEGDLFLRLIDPDGELPELTFRGRSVKSAIEQAWEYAKNEEKAWKIAEESAEESKEEPSEERKESKEESPEEKSEEEKKEQTIENIESSAEVKEK